MKEMNDLRNFLVKRIETINKEIRDIEEKKDIISLKIKISSILSNDFNNVVLCRDEEVYKLIKASSVDINFDDYRSMKFIISNRDLFRGFVPPQLVAAKEQAQKFLVDINYKLDEQKSAVDSYLSRISLLKEELNKCENLMSIITSNGLRKPIMDTDFVLNFLATVSISDRDKTEIMQKLIVLNVEALREAMEKRNLASKLSIPVEPIVDIVTSPVVEQSELSDKQLDKDSDERLSGVVLGDENESGEDLKQEEIEAKSFSEVDSKEIRKGLRGQRVKVSKDSKETLKIDVSSFLDEEQLDVYQTALSIVKSENNPSLLGYVNVLNGTINDIKATCELLHENNGASELKDELSNEIKYLDETVCDYQNNKRNFIRQSVLEQDASLLRPFEKYRLIYFMHPENKPNLTEEDFFEEGLTSFFEEDCFDSDNVNNYMRISKLLNELRSGLIENRRRKEHMFKENGLRGYHVKKDYKARIGFRIINDDTILVTGYGVKTGNDNNYAKAWANREKLYGSCIDKLVDRINNDSGFRKKVYCYFRNVDDRIMDVLETKNKKTKKL